MESSFATACAVMLLSISRPVSSGQQCGTCDRTLTMHLSTEDALSWALQTLDPKPSCTVNAAGSGGPLAPSASYVTVISTELCSRQSYVFSLSDAAMPEGWGWSSLLLSVDDGWTVLHQSSDQTVFGSRDISFRVPNPIPTPSPTQVPTLQPTPSPTRPPTHGPTPAPTPDPSTAPLTCPSDGTAVGATRGTPEPYIAQAKRDFLGYGIAHLGLLSGPRRAKVAVGGIGASDDDGVATGAVFVLEMDTSGTVVSAKKISNRFGNLGMFVTLLRNEAFGIFVANIGDIDGNGVDDLAVGGTLGSFFFVCLDANDHVVSATRVNKTALGSAWLATVPDTSEFGRSVVSVGDLNGDGIGPDLVVGDYYDNDGAVQAGALYILFKSRNGTAAASLPTKISNLHGGLSTWYTVGAGDLFAISLASVGPSRFGEGLVEVAVGACFDDDGGDPSVENDGPGAVYLLGIDPDGTVAHAQKLSNLHGGLANFYPLGLTDNFGRSVASLGDADNDGYADIAVGAMGVSDSTYLSGAVFILFLDSSGRVHNAQKISNTHGGFNSFYSLRAGATFGRSLTAIDDLNGDGSTDIIVGSPLERNEMVDSKILNYAGAEYVVFLRALCPSAPPTPVPSSLPTPLPTPSPSVSPAPTISSPPTIAPSPLPSPVPTITLIPSLKPTAVPRPQPSMVPTPVPFPQPTSVPRPEPSAVPTTIPLPQPSRVPRPLPTAPPTSLPSAAPSSLPSLIPSPQPTLERQHRTTWSVTFGSSIAVVS